MNANYSISSAGMLCIKHMRHYPMGSKCIECVFEEGGTSTHKDTGGTIYIEKDPPNNIPYPSADKHGTERLQELGEQIGKLVAEKNEAYGSAFIDLAKMLEVLWPDGIKPEQYIDVGLVTRICDKLKRIASRKDAFGESPYKDISGYGILGVFNDENEKFNEKDKKSSS